MKKRIEMAGFKLDPDDKRELMVEAFKRNLTLSSLLDKIVGQHLMHCKDLLGKPTLDDLVESALKEIDVSLVDDGRITPDEAVRIAQRLVALESEIFECKDYREGVPA